MKIVRAGALPVGGDSGLLDVRDRALKPFGASPRCAVRRRRRTSGPAYVDACSRSSTSRRSAPLRVVDRRRERDGRRDAAARARAPADRRGRAATSSRTGASRTTSRTRCCPRTASSSSRRRWRRTPTSGSPSTATPTAASSSTTRASSCPATSSPPSSPSRSCEKEPGAKVIYDVRASWAVPRDDRARRRHRARQPGRPRLHQAPHARGGRRLRRRGLGALLLPRLLAGRLRRRPVPAHARADLEERAASSRSSCAPYRERYFLTGEINTPGRRRRASSSRSWRSASARRAPSPISTGSRSTPTTGTSTSAPRTPSRSCASTSRRARRS